METKDSAVHLLRLWKEAKNTYEVALLYFQGSEIPFVEEMREISRRLDEISGAAGISIGENGGFKYKLHGHILSPFFELKDYYGEAIPAREQQAIQEWLLIKNEEKTA